MKMEIKITKRAGPNDPDYTPPKKKANGLKFVLGSQNPEFKKDIYKTLRDPQFDNKMEECENKIQCVTNSLRERRLNLEQKLRQTGRDLFLKINKKRLCDQRPMDQQSYAFHQYLLKFFREKIDAPIQAQVLQKEQQQEEVERQDQYYLSGLTQQEKQIQENPQILTKILTNYEIYKQLSIQFPIYQQKIFSYLFDLHQNENLLKKENSYEFLLKPFQKITQSEFQQNVAKKLKQYNQLGQEIKQMNDQDRMKKVHRNRILSIIMKQIVTKMGLFQKIQAHNLKSQLQTEFQDQLMMYRLQRKRKSKQKEKDQFLIKSQDHQKEDMQSGQKSIKVKVESTSKDQKQRQFKDQFNGQCKEQQNISPSSQYVIDLNQLKAMKEHQNYQQLINQSIKQSLKRRIYDCMNIFGALDIVKKFKSKVVYPNIQFVLKNIRKRCQKHLATKLRLQKTQKQKVVNKIRHKLQDSYKIRKFMQYFTSDYHQDTRKKYSDLISEQRLIRLPFWIYRAKRSETKVLRGYNEVTNVQLVAIKNVRRISNEDLLNSALQGLNIIKKSYKNERKQDSKVKKSDSIIRIQKKNQKRQESMKKKQPEEQVSEHNIKNEKSYYMNKVISQRAKLQNNAQKSLKFTQKVKIQQPIQMYTINQNFKKQLPIQKTQTNQYKRCLQQPKKWLQYRYQINKQQNHLLQQSVQQKQNLFNIISLIQRFDEVIAFFEFKKSNQNQYKLGQPKMKVGKLIGFQPFTKQKKQPQ